jgi:hypothetical protein
MDLAQGDLRPEKLEHDKIRLIRRCNGSELPLPLWVG